MVFQPLKLFNLSNLAVHSYCSVNNSFKPIIFSEYGEEYQSIKGWRRTVPWQFKKTEDNVNRSPTKRVRIDARKIKWDQKYDNNLKSSLLSHLKNHLDKRRYKCNICEKKFLCKSKVARHIRTHTDEKKFCCHICAVKFRWKSCLQRHMRRHRPIESESEPDPEPRKVNCNLFKL